MRAVTHPGQSAAITVLTMGICVGFLTFESTRTGPTRANFVGLILAVIFALGVWGSRSATRPAAIAGAIIAATLYLGTVHQPAGRWWHTALPPLITLLVLTLFATRFRRNTKEHLGVAEAKSGRQASQVCANLGVAALASTLGVGLLPHTLMLLALTAALVEATVDTVSSEMGQAIPGKTFLLTSFQQVPVGTDGGISVVGTAAGCMGAALVAALSGIGLGLTVRQTLLCWLAGIAGLFFDSWLGATLERKGVLGNDAVNFLSTLFSASLVAIFGAMCLS